MTSRDRRLRLTEQAVAWQPGSAGEFIHDGSSSKAYKDSANFVDAPVIVIVDWEVLCRASRS